MPLLVTFTCSGAPRALVVTASCMLKAWSPRKRTWPSPLDFGLLQENDTCMPSAMSLFFDLQSPG
ncbi:hypothetical protein BA896_000885 [Janthinobacterium lividum]|uniref:Uncharacterized protein n=1 Tax=Janthinobacterium lividum TaxID=29581 RepID=A0A1E8PPX4_9BURK|nr:hypothetical protein BA896_000885 [Janthinobacterium lividum]